MSGFCEEAENCCFLLAAEATSVEEFQARL